MPETFQPSCHDDNQPRLFDSARGHLFPSLPDEDFRARPDVCIGCLAWRCGGCGIINFADVSADRYNHCKYRDEYEKDMEGRCVRAK